jgi:hypothetical protein
MAFIFSIPVKLLGMIREDGSVRRPLESQAALEEGKLVEVQVRAPFSM